MYSLETEQLMAEIEDATGRVSALVGAAKQYSQMDRSAQQTFDVHDGLDATLVMMGKKLARPARWSPTSTATLPSIPGFPGELNQVWTNLVDNAAGAMGGQGTLTVRTARDDDSVLVEVGDTGPGVPEDLRRRIFEPFFTTKPVGEGTGLGLDISFRIVVNRHGGDLRVRQRARRHPVPGAAADQGGRAARRRRGVTARGLTGARADVESGPAPRHAGRVRRRPRSRRRVRRGNPWRTRRGPRLP